VIRYMGGHSDLTAGTVSSHSASLMSRLGKAAKLLGGPLPGFDSFLLVSGHFSRHGAVRLAHARVRVVALTVYLEL